MGVTIEFDYYVCSSCAGVYGYPDKYSSYKRDCPYCQRRAKDDLEERVDELIDERDTLERRISGLRGTITKLKRKEAQ
jgi:PHP family Zn ribbon phosphoesterase